MPTETISLSWESILALAFSTGCVAALITSLIAWCKDWLTDKSSRKRHATYLALRIAVILEDFAIRCADLISDQDLHSQSDGHAGASHGTIPALPEYPQDGAWEMLDPQLSARVLAIPNEIKLGQGTINFWWDVLADEDCVFTACSQQSGKCGYRAWVIAADLRKKYGLPQFDPKQVSWDVPKVLLKEHDAAIAEVKKQHEEQIAA